MAAENLLEIPTEILSLVFKHLDTELLRVSALVCKYFNALSEPWLYRDIIILRGSHGFALANAFLANPERTKWVRSLLVSTKFGDDDGLHSLPPWILQVSCDFRLFDGYVLTSLRWTIFEIYGWKHRIAT